MGDAEGSRSPLEGETTPSPGGFANNATMTTLRRYGVQLPRGPTRVSRASVRSQRLSHEYDPALIALIAPNPEHLRERVPAPAPAPGAGAAPATGRFFVPARRVEPDGDRIGGSNVEPHVLVSHLAREVVARGEERFRDASAAVFVRDGHVAQVRRV